VTRQVTLRKEKPSCLLESQPLVATAGVIIRGQMSIPLMARASGISTNMPKATTGIRASANFDSRYQGLFQHRDLAQVRARARKALVPKSDLPLDRAEAVIADPPARSSHRTSKHSLQPPLFSDAPKQAITNHRQETI